MDESKTLMTEGRIWKILIRFAMPLFLGNLFQQLYNTVDSLVVGNYCGKATLAAVSSSGSLCHLLIGFFQGAFMGASVIISRYYGAGDQENVDRAVHTTVVFSLGTGLVLTIFGVCFTPTILRWMGTPDNVLPQSVIYFRIYCAGLLSLVLYNTANGIFQALGDSRHPLYYLVTASVVNVVLDLFFVAVLDWGVAGAALATVLGQALSAALGFAYLMSGRFVVRIRPNGLRFHPAILKDIFRLGLPSGVQNSVISIANLVVQANINAFGDSAMAGCGSYFKVEGFVFLPISSLSLAITTFISQNLGARRPDRAHSGARVGTVMTSALAEAVGLIFFLTAPFLIQLFNSDPEVVAFGVRQARLEALFYFLLGFSHAAAATLRGAGRAMTPMVVLLSVWCIFRIAYITVMVSFFHDITVVFSAYPVTWGISSVLFAAALCRSDWASAWP